jgi:hypothetical protein
VTPVFRIDSPLWRVAGGRGEMRFIGALPAREPVEFLRPIREELVDPARRDSIRRFYFRGPGRFVLFSSAIDIAIGVTVEEYR